MDLALNSVTALLHILSYEKRVCRTRRLYCHWGITMRYLNQSNTKEGRSNYHDLDSFQKTFVPYHPPTWRWSGSKVIQTRANRSTLILRTLHTIRLHRYCHSLGYVCAAWRTHHQNPASQINHITVCEIALPMQTRALLPSFQRPMKPSHW